MTAAAETYELVGNALCLDFANTVNQRSDPRRDWLTEPGGLLRWARHAGLLPAEAGSRRPEADDVDADVDAAGLREAVYLAFSAVAAGRDPDPSDLAVITAVAGEGLTAAALVRSSVLSDHPDHPGGAGRAAYRPTDGQATYGVDWVRQGERGVVWAVADSAVELLRHGPLDRVGECPSCGWVFLDTSRNGRRRWCSMAMCGGAVKSARHYARRDRTGR